MNADRRDAPTSPPAICGEFFKCSSIVMSETDCRQGSPHLTGLTGNSFTAFEA
jgi:hypothetical protein